MKKSLIKCLSLAGLTLTGVSCEKQESNPLETSKDYPSPLNSSITQKVGFTPIMELNLPDSINNQIVTLSELTKDVFENPSVAKSFSADPQGYFESKGLEGFNIDLNSVEIKAILALGDQDVRRAIEANDLFGFIRILENKKYISFDNVYSNLSMKEYIASQIKDNKKLLEDLPVIDKAPFWFIAVGVVAYVVAATMFWVYMSIEVYGPDGKPSYKIGQGGNGSGSGFSFDNPVLKLWGLKTNSSDIPVVNELLDQNLDKMVDVIEMMDVYQQSNEKMERQDLKNWLRKPVTQYFIDNGLI